MTVTEEWVKAWSGNAPIIVNDNEISLPPPPEGHDWLITRELTGEHPTYRLALHFIGEDSDDFRVLAHGKIDKTMYGEKGVQQYARYILERL
ncbi:hypothetical protein JRC04_04590 [Mycolicibacterium sp. S2-37]|uniref:hypothetical protein n=1 Tax=Mycolicibacterium sp. S2-37 TaxID=2810297 RepID=UPI001A945D47|nr:hypothetical protein [Mycolicibacterium sp. S2-37]MBO0676736.1 hypothetical protein [Mycolicibacterium sp. S2-37]